MREIFLYRGEDGCLNSDPNSIKVTECEWNNYDRKQTRTGPAGHSGRRIRPIETTINQKICHVNLIFVQVRCLWWFTHRVCGEHWISGCLPYFFRGLPVVDNHKRRSKWKFLPVSSWISLQKYRIGLPHTLNLSLKSIANVIYNISIYLSGKFAVWRT